MANLIWDPAGKIGPATTQDLADEVETEGYLGRLRTIDDRGVRCLWGVINDVTWDLDGGIDPKVCRYLTEESAQLLESNGLSSLDNDVFTGTPEERCQEMARRLRIIL